MRGGVFKKKMSLGIENQFILRLPKVQYRDALYTYKKRKRPRPIFFVFSIGSC